MFNMSYDWYYIRRMRSELTYIKSNSEAYNRLYNELGIKTQEKYNDIVYDPINKIYIIQEDEENWKKEKSQYEQKEVSTPTDDTLLQKVYYTTFSYVLTIKVMKRLLNKILTSIQNYMYYYSQLEYPSDYNNIEYNDTEAEYYVPNIIEKYLTKTKSKKTNVNTNTRRKKTPEIKKRFKNSPIKKSPINDTPIKISPLPRSTKRTHQPSIKKYFSTVPTKENKIISPIPKKTTSPIKQKPIKTQQQSIKNYFPTKDTKQNQSVKKSTSPATLKKSTSPITKLNKLTPTPTLKKSTPVKHNTLNNYFKTTKQ